MTLLLPIHSHPQRRWWGLRGSDRSGGGRDVVGVRWRCRSGVGEKCWLWLNSLVSSMFLTGLFCCCCSAAGRLRWWCMTARGDGNGVELLVTLMQRRVEMWWCWDMRRWCKGASVDVDCAGDCWRWGDLDSLLLVFYPLPFSATFRMVLFKKKIVWLSYFD